MRARIRGPHGRAVYELVGGLLDVPQVGRLVVQVERLARQLVVRLAEQHLHFVVTRVLLREALELGQRRRGIGLDLGAHLVGDRARAAAGQQDRGGESDHDQEQRRARSHGAAA